MSEVLTAEEIKKRKEQGHSDGYILCYIALPQIETFQAQVRGLTEALTEAVQAIDNLRNLTFNTLGHWELVKSVPGAQSAQAYKLAEKALSTLPAEWLERFKAEKKLIASAKTLSENTDAYGGSFYT